MAYLEVIDGPHRGTNLPVEDVFSIGRAPSNSMCLHDGRASRQHAVIGPAPDGGRELVDLGSVNGTYVGSERLKPHKAVLLEDGDRITIGATQMVFHAASAEKPTGRSPDLSASTGVLSAVGIYEEPAPELTAVTLTTMNADIDVRALSGEREASELEQVVNRLEAMVKVSADLAALTDESELLDKIMEGTFDVFPQADRAFIMRRDRATGEMVTRAARDRAKGRLEPDECQVSRTILNTVLDNRQSVLSSDAQEDFGAQQSIIDLHIRSTMSVPLIFDEEVLGVMNVESMSGIQAFVADDLALLTSIAAQASLSVKNQELFADIENETKTRSQLSRYLSPDIVEGVLEGTVPLELGGKQARGTVFFADIVGFTSMSETLTGVEVVEKLNRYFAVTTDVVTRNDGTLHKFGGDMIMAFWNVMFPDDEPEYKAIRTSLEMQAAVWAFNVELLDEGKQPIYLGVGCNTGEFAAGNIGGEGRMEYTVIGDNVNLGQRIESLAGRWQVFVSESTYEPVRERAVAIALPPASLKGKSEAIPVYSIRGLRVSPSALRLCLPVRFRGGDVQGAGLLTGLESGFEGLRLMLSTDVSVPLDTTLKVETDLPELDRIYQMAGVVEEIEPVGSGQGEYRRVTLTGLTGDRETLSFLRPGSLVESDLDWSQIKRS